MYAVIRDEAVLVEALKLARGCYQRNILLGHEAVSGSTLRGRARNYSGRYKQSACAILGRCKAAGLPIGEMIGEHNKRLVVIG